LVKPQVHAVSLSNGYVISDDRERLDMEFVHGALADAYWAIGRSRALTERSWANCLCFGIYSIDGTQVGCARLLTDYAFRAHLGDVVIQPASRGLGLGKALVETILAHPELATVSLWTLTTADAHGLYARYGFRPGETPRPAPVAERPGRIMSMPKAGTVASRPSRTVKARERGSIFKSGESIAVGV
jgi:GNAT superfamily N-acetyltransferase